MLFVILCCNLWLSVLSEWVTEMESKYFTAGSTLNVSELFSTFNFQNLPYNTCYAISFSLFSLVCLVEYSHFHKNKLCGCENRLK